MQFLEYKIIEDVSLDRFQQTINELIRQGWEPHGQLIIVPRHEHELADGLFQVMVKVRRDAP
jgi:hypothetical protein